MRLTITTLLSLMGSFAFAQNVDPETQLITYTDVVEVPSVSKNELYVRANTWMARTFKSSKAVIQLDDKEAGKLIGKGNIPVVIKVPIMGKIDAGRVTGTLTIICKDNKYKYTIDNLYHERPYGANTQNWVDGGPLEQEKVKAGMMSRPSKREWNDIKESTDADWKVLIADLRKSMGKSDTDF